MDPPSNGWVGNRELSRLSLLWASSDGWICVAARTLPSRSLASLHIYVYRCGRLMYKATLRIYMYLALIVWTHDKHFIRYRCALFGNEILWGHSLSSGLLSPTLRGELTSSRRVFLWLYVINSDDTRECRLSYSRNSITLGENARRSFERNFLNGTPARKASRRTGVSEGWRGAIMRYFINRDYSRYSLVQSILV